MSGCFKNELIEEWRLCVSVGVCARTLAAAYPMICCALIDIYDFQTAAAATRQDTIQPDFKRSTENKVLPFKRQNITICFDMQSQHMRLPSFFRSRNSILFFVQKKQAKLQLRFMVRKYVSFMHVKLA